MTKRIKILFTIPNFDTAGSGKVVYDLVKYIDKDKFEPHIACNHNRGAFFKTIESLNVPIHIYQCSAEYRPFISLPFRIWKIRTFFKKHQFDVIHSWHWSSDFTEPLAAKLAGIPFVYTKKAMGWGNRSWIWRSQLSTKIITINTDMVTQFFSNMVNKVVPIPIGLNVSDFGILEKTYSTPDGYSVSKNDFVIVSIANLVAVKGIEYLLEAVKSVANPNLKVFVVGDKTSAYAQHLEKDYGSKQIIFTGKKQNIKDYLAMADVFVIPTKNEGRKEGQPIAPIEAMLSGRIVLGSNISGINDILHDFPELLFAPDDVKDLIVKLNRIMKMYERDRIFLATQLFNFASSKYMIDNSIGLHQKLYREINNKYA